MLKIDRAGGRLIGDRRLSRSRQPARQAAPEGPVAPPWWRSTRPAAASNVTGVAGVELLNTRGEARDPNDRRPGDRHPPGRRQSSSPTAGPSRRTTFDSDVQLDRIRNEVTLNTRGGDVKGSELARPDRHRLERHRRRSSRSCEKTTGIVRINAGAGSVTVEGTSNRRADRRPRRRGRRGRRSRGAARDLQRGRGQRGPHAAGRRAISSTPSRAMRA